MDDPSDDLTWRIVEWASVAIVAAIVLIPLALWWWRGWWARHR
jgi:hypothetical protein